MVLFVKLVNHKVELFRKWLGHFGLFLKHKFDVGNNLRKVCYASTVSPSKYHI